jgi:hypothetical protein
MHVEQSDKSSLVQVLVEEASNVDLICHLAHTGGSEALRDLLECVRDAEFLSTDALLYNISVVRQKTAEAHACPMNRVFGGLMRRQRDRSHALAMGAKISNGDAFHSSPSLH